MRLAIVFTIALPVLSAAAIVAYLGDGSSIHRGWPDVGSSHQPHSAPSLTSVLTHRPQADSVEPEYAPVAASSTALLFVRVLHFDSLHVPSEV